MAAALTEAVRAKALALGFAAVGVTTADDVAGGAEALAAFVAEGRQGDMEWLADNTPRRARPRLKWAAAKSVLVVADNYGPGKLAAVGAGRGTISVYARGRDYHDVIKKRLKALSRWLADSHGAQSRLFVDTAPVMEKPLAARAGLGWQGRHTNLVSRRFGSWLFLGGLLTDLELVADAAETDHCGSCRACEAACPTAALADGRIDARRCISYLTIEHRGDIDADLLPLIGDRIYGCDDCLAVCPWNKFASPAADPAYQPRAELQRPRLADLAGLDDAAFRAVFSGSPIKRIGRDRFLRNVLIAIGNSGRGDLRATAARLLADPAPLVRQMAAWALRRLGG